MIESWRWSYFTPAEVLGPFGLEQLNKQNLMLQPEALTMLDRFRSYVGKPLICNGGENRARGYRSPFENAACGGVEGSRHVQGLAFDLSCEEIPTAELYEIALKYGWTGIGLYIDRGFIHVDRRPLLPGFEIITWEL